jgi:putative ABC transport system permease protein
VVRALDRKLLRDTWRLRGQLFSISLIVAAGIMAVITLQSTFRSLEAARDDYYDAYRFADIFASLNRAPLAVAARVELLPGVAAVDTRVTMSVPLHVPGLPLPASARVISIPERGQPPLNRIHLRSGRWVEPGRYDEVLVSERFAQINGLAPGDTLTAVLNGRERRLTIAGIALSPEFLYEVDPGAGLISDERLFGIVWMGRGGVEAAHEMTGAVNDLAVRLAPGASTRRVMAQVDDLLQPYGGLGAVPRSDQISNRLLQDEIAQNRVTATVLPIVFVGIAAFLLNIVLLRLISLERDQIGTLKAFGYADLTIAMHYLRLAGLAVAAGALLGIAAGLWLGASYTALYGDHFKFPQLRHSVSWGTAAAALGVSAVAALAGAWSAIRAAARLQPAEAMRPEPPASFAPLFIERWGLHRYLSAAQRMVLRNLERRPGRAFVSALGVAFSVAILLIGMTLLDSVRTLMDVQFRVVQREDASVTFTRAVDIAGVRDLARLPGVAAAEGFRSVPVRLMHGHRTRLVSLTGLQPGSSMRPMADEQGATHPLPEGGLVLSERLAQVLGARRGDMVRIELLDRGGATHEVEIVALMQELLGLNAYMAAGELSRLTRETPLASGAYLRIRRGEEAAVFEALRARPVVASTTSKNAMIRSFETQMADSMTITMTILILLAGVLATGVIYNGARIALSERGRELASLRVLGFTRAEVAYMLLGEQAAITLLGLPLGMLLGAGISALIASSYDTELYRMPFVLDPGTFVTAGLIVCAIAVVAALLVRRRLDRADLIAVLKTRE